MPNLPEQLRDESLEREESAPQLALGQWYWVTSTRQVKLPGETQYQAETYEWLGCVMALGSNYVELKAPRQGNYSAGARVHFDDVFTDLRFEPNAPAVIQAKVSHYQQESARLLGEVKALTAQLGLKPVGVLPGQSGVESGTALVTLSAQPDIGSYKQALVLAKEKTLPDLFDAIKEANAALVCWMTADTLPMEAVAGQLKASVGEIEDRIFNVSLYAGLVEEAVPCCEGAPAAMEAKLHVMQRRCYMDEECLLAYQAGGLEFKDIRAFDAWISQPENRDRILPFPRTLVAMRVRRKSKEREWDGSLLGAFVKMHLDQTDKLTFLYLRNGEQVWRISTEMDFGELIFPDKSMFSPGEPQMAKIFCGSIQTMITRSEYEDLKAKYDAVQAAAALWKQNNPGKTWMDNPHSSSLSGDVRINGQYFNPREWTPFDQSSLHFDECMREVETRIKEYNRIALIIQGLFDRSLVFHPHPPVQTWTPAGFERAITLVFDGTMVLTHGAAPDFEAYRARCNALLKVGSVVTGQELYWLKQEAAKENERERQRNHRDLARYRHKTYKPYGNPGPGRVAKVVGWKPRAQQATFAWTRSRLRDPGFFKAQRERIPCSLTVPVAELLNVSAYTPGDFKQFFQDPRTRADYIQWAPLLLTAEDFHAGKLALRADASEDDD